MFSYNAELAAKELFLMQYVLCDAVSEKDMFGLLCRIYCVSEAEREEIAALLGDKKLCGIRTVNDYYRVLRTKEYYQNFGGGYVIDDERIEELVAIKGTTIEQASKSKLVPGYERSAAVAYDELVSLAFGGLVCAKRILGILQAEGIYIAKDTRAGLKNLRAAADWSDVRGLITMLYYSAENRIEYMNRLYTVALKSDCGDITEALQKKYGINNCKPSEEVKLLEKAFAAGTVKRDVCSAQHLRLLRSNTVSEKDKLSVLLGGNKELLSAVCGLPLRLTRRKIEPTGPIKSALNRVEEQKAIARALGNNELRDRDFFRCLCVCSNSEYVREAYAEAIAASFSDCNVVNIDVGALYPIDFDSAENNVFVRSCLEKTDNIYIVKLSGEQDERIVNLIKSFALCGGRRTFNISRLGISIDLGAVLPVFVCDKKNTQLLGGAVEVIKAAEVTDGEKELALTELLRGKRADFATGEITLDGDARALLLTLPIDKIGGVLDRAVLSERNNGEPVRLTLKTLKAHIGDRTEQAAYGFGGTHAKK